MYAVKRDRRPHPAKASNPWRLFKAS
jgi:hypothetical protein